VLWCGTSVKSSIARRTQRGRFVRGAQNWPALFPILCHLTALQLSEDSMHNSDYLAEGTAGALASEPILTSESGIWVSEFGIKWRTTDQRRHLAPALVVGGLL
jgi:hypothetical protein